MTKRTTVRSIQAALAAHGASPRKSFSQNFLIDQGVLKDIVDASELNLADTVLEVGPGLGALTRALAPRVNRVVAVEKDRAFVRLLQGEFAPSTNVSIVQGDILKLPLKELGVGGGYKVVANIPYHITSRFLRRFLETDARPSFLVLMVQREVAERIIASPPDMNLLALSVQLFAKPEIVRRVPASAFWPRPKVTSAIVRLTTRHPPFSPKDLEAFFKIAHASFQGKRKQLINSLSVFAPDKASLADILKEADIGPNERPEQISLEKWINLVRILGLRIV